MSKINLVGVAPYKGRPNAMVLDVIDNQEFIFKNTYESDKQVRVAMDDEDAPEEFFFVHINYKN